jgi:hypothetical protein
LTDGWRRLKGEFMENKKCAKMLAAMVVAGLSLTASTALAQREKTHSNNFVCLRKR